MFRTVQNSSEHFRAAREPERQGTLERLDIWGQPRAWTDELVVVWTVDRKKLELQQNVKYMEFAAYDLKTDREFMLLGRNGRVR